MAANKPPMMAIACSGGADSLALAIMAAAEQEIIALIVDHKLRKESEFEAKRTEAILKTLKIKAKILAPKKSEIKKNVQNSARKLRYELMTDYCKKNGIKILATAHHADDVAENVLLRVSRGSGVDGLSGIPEITEIKGVKIIRPLLKFRKAELENFLREKNIKWVNDPTNDTNKYKRNNLRHALNLLEDKDLITERLCDLAENMSRVRNFLEAETAKAEKLCVSYKKGGAELDIKKFLDLHQEIQFRLLVKIIMSMANPEYKPRFEKIKNLRNALLTEKKASLSGIIFTPACGKAKETLYIINHEKTAKAT